MVNSLLKGFNHEGRNFVGYSSAERGIKRVDKLVFDGEFNLGRRRCGLASDWRQVPESLKSLKDGGCILGRAA